jgi:pyruvate/2-oxoglutarate dehydrogenase complex dihydrolipoamide acyltransferase (E2) component
MAEVTVVLPQFGMGMQDGEIVRWLKAVGDNIQEGETLAEVEAAKTTVELPSPASGKVVKLIAEIGDTIEVRSPIAVIETA